MPLVKIDLAAAQSSSQIQGIGNAIHTALVDVFRIPDNDRFQVVTLHNQGEVTALDAGLGFRRIGSPVVIQIFTQAGREPQTKQLLYRTITANLALVGVDPSAVFISYIENSPEDWSFGFGKAQYLIGELKPHK